MTQYRGSEQGYESVRGGLRHAVDRGPEFLHEHEFFGREKDFPKTVVLVKELAAQISAGAIDYDTADRQATRSLDEECNELLGGAESVEGLLAQLSGMFEPGLPRSVRI